MKFILESPTGPYTLRSLIIWSFLILFSILYAFLTSVNIHILPASAYVLCLLFTSLVLAMQIPNPAEKEKETTQIVTYSFVFGIFMCGSVNLLLFTILKKWPVITLTAFGTLAIVLSTLFGYFCANDAKLYD